MTFTGSFRHVGYVVADLDEAIAHFTRLFELDVRQVDVVPAREVEAETRFAFFEVGGCVFELIHPISDRFVEALKPSGITIDHVAFTVPDVEGEVARLGSHGIVPGHVTPDGVIAMPRQKMCYLDPARAGGVLLELVEPLDVGDPDRRW